MREILFRGKRMDNGEWVYGNYIQSPTLPYMHMIEDRCPSISDTGLRTFQGCPRVYPNTVGQFTGLLDKNGKRIFEGDIVTFTRENALGYTARRRGDVRYYDKLPIFYIMANTGDAWDWCECNEIEVIGNIHDNPELLEVTPDE